MSIFYIANGACRYVSNDELRHHGVKGMKWGRRKARPMSSGVSRRSGQTNSNQNEVARKEARRAKVKKAVKIGAAVAATCLAAYGAKKAHDFVRNKHMQLRVQEGSRQINRALSMYGVSGYGSNYEYMKLGEWKDRVYADHMRTVRSNARADSFGVAAKNVAGHYQSEIERKIDPYTRQLTQKASQYKRDLSRTRKIKNAYRRR